MGLVARKASERVGALSLVHKGSAESSRTGACALDGLDLCMGGGGPLEPARVEGRRLAGRHEGVMEHDGVLVGAEPDEQPVPCGESEGDDQWRVVLAGTDVGSRVLAVVTVPS